MIDVDTLDPITDRVAYILALAEQFEHSDEIAVGPTDGKIIADALRESAQRAERIAQLRTNAPTLVEERGGLDSIY